MPDAQGGHLPQRVVGRYALYGEIASGGMATVHFGRLLGPVGFSRTVAIKRLHPQFAKDPEFVSMFLDEARVAARIQHPNVVATLDVVALQGELFLVMEYVQGESLARILKLHRARGEQVPPKTVGSIATNLLFGLHAAHEAKSERGEPLGIVHRDVSPQNVLVGTDGVSRVLDFGVAKAAGRIQVTRDGQVKGKLAYMPPEQLAGGEIDRRADVYAASVVIWEALTGQRLFEGDSQSVVLARVLTAKVPPPSELRPGLPPGVDEVVLRGLSRNPDLRFANAHEMAVALEDTLGIETPRRIGEFLQRCAHDALAAKAARVKEIESVDTDTALRMMAAVPSAGAAEGAGLAERSAAASLPDAPSPGAEPAPGEASGLSKVSNVSLSAPGGPPPRRGAVIALLGACGVGLAIGVAWWSMSGPVDAASGGPIASSAPSSAPSSPSTSATSVPAPSTEAPAIPTSEAPTAASAAPSAPTSGAPAVRPGPGPSLPPKPTNKPSSAAPPSKPPAAPGGCDPPYTIDATGKRKLKSWCL